jgi:hypothetical protein
MKQKLHFFRSQKCYINDDLYQLMKLTKEELVKHVKEINIKLNNKSVEFICWEFDHYKILGKADHDYLCKFALQHGKIKVGA